MEFTLTSSAFAPGARIPTRHTCDADDLSPPLAWSDPPEGTESLALISDDPDAPVGTWVHWVIFDIPATVRSLPEGLSTAGDPDSLAGARQGTNDFRRLGYGGPCPPSGTHRYFFRLYALDTALGLKPGASRADVDRAMSGHILAEAELMGKYSR